MSSICKSLKDLSFKGHWDEVFSCLNIDANTTIELASLKKQQNDLWLDDHKTTLNSLEVILGFILLCDQIFYILLLLYLSLFFIKFLRLRVFGAIQRRVSKAKTAVNNYKPKKATTVSKNMNVTQRIKL